MSIEVYVVCNDPVQWKKDLLAAPIGTEVEYIWKASTTRYGSSPLQHRFKKVKPDVLEHKYTSELFHVDNFSCGKHTDTTGWAVVRKIDVVEELD